MTQREPEFCEDCGAELVEDQFGYGRFDCPDCEPAGAGREPDYNAPSSAERAELDYRRKRECR